MNKITVGIDLGTTYSAVSTFDKTKGEPVILKNSFGDEYTPSVVFIENGSVTIGSEAKSLQSAGNANAAAFYKTWMGNKNFSLYLDGDNYSSEDLSGIYLKELIKDIEMANNVEIDGAVITVPAYFNEAQRQATINAGKAAGIKVLKIINEPTAAIIAYGLTGEGNKKVMVYDLGGGTFDITIADVKGSVVSVLGTNGDHQLGGKDWDLILRNYLAESFENEFGVCIDDYPEESNELQVECENVKKKLTNLQKVTATVSCDGNIGRYEITKEWFEEQTSDLLSKTQLLINECLTEIGESTDGSGIDEIVLVGGSTRMPQVKEMIKREYGKYPITNVNVDTVVAKGAAIQAAICAEKTVTLSLGPAPRTANLAGQTSQPARRVLTLSSDSIRDVTAHSLGMISVSEDKSRYVNTIIIPKNEKVPSTQQKPFKINTRRGGDGIIEVYILQGESLVPSDNHILGKYVISGIEPQSEQESVIDISYTYNENGMVDVTAVQRKTGKSLTVTKTEVPEDMSWVDEAPKIEEIKISSTIYLVIDVSGSMSSAMSKVEQAARAFVDDMDLTSSKIGVVVFADRVTTACKPTNRIKDIYGAIKDACAFKHDVGGATSGKPFEYLNTNFGKMDEKNYLVVLTDGQWFKATEEIANSQKIKSKGIDIVALGFADADRAFLKKIASSDESALKTDLNSLKGAFSTIAQAITEGSGKVSLS